YMFTKSKKAITEKIVLPKEPPKQPVARAEAAEEKELAIPKIDNSRISYLQDKRNLKNPAVNSPDKIKTPAIQVEKTLFVKKGDSVIMKLAGNKVRQFSDSLLKETRDSLLFVSTDTLLIKPFVEPPVEKKDVYRISPYVFTAKDGNVNIALADWNNKKYSVRFFEDDNTPLIEIKDIKDPLLIIDKTNFLHSGWFRFELYEDGRLKEKNKLFIPKEF
ncbi:MAG TPA: hypothetical protein VGM24_02355, partial [Puia sp.]